MTRKIIIIVMLLAATTARAFDFRVEVAAGQKVYFTIIAGTNTVKVVNPDWDSYTPPSGALTLPATVENNSTTYSVVAIDERAFQGCTGITAIVVPEGVTRIGRLAFAQCSALESISLPSTLTVLGSYAFTGTAYFGNNDNITDEGLLFIGAYLIASAPSSVGSAVVLPEGTLGVGNMALYTCSTVERVTLPATVRFIGEQAFNGCSSLDTLELLGAVPPTLESNAFTDVGTFTVLVPCQSGNTYRSAPNWNAQTIVEKCSQAGVEIADAPLPTVTTVAGGITIANSGQEGCRVSDLLGRQIARCRDGFVALPCHGVYVVTLPGGKSIKVMYR